MVVSSERSLSSLSESEILERGIQILKQIVPDAWEVKLEDGPDGSVGKRGDAMLSIAVAKQHHLRTIVDARRSFAPRDVGTVLGEPLGRREKLGMNVIRHTLSDG